MDTPPPTPISPIPAPPRLSPVAGAVEVLGKLKPAGDLTPGGMLALQRGIEESIMITIPGRAKPVVIHFARYRRSSRQAVLCVFAEKDIEVDREEIWRAKQQERIAAAAGAAEGAAA